MRLWGRRHQGIPLGTHGTIIRRKLHLAGDDLRSHIHVLGKSGSGKSRWLAGFYVNLLRAGYSATLIDPHGDLARLVLSQLVATGFFDKSDAFDRLLYLDIPAAARAGRYLRANMLAQPYDTYTTTRLILEALRRAFPELDRNSGSPAPAFEQVVTAGVHVLVENNLPFPMLRSLLINKPLRDTLLRNVRDGLVTSFFTDEYDRWEPQERTIVRQSTMRRLFLLLYNPILRYSLGARDNLVDFRTILDRNRSLIVNLAVPDPDTKRLLGCLLTVFAEQGALSRADLPPGSRFGLNYLILDEFHSFVGQSTEAITAMLSQTRKFSQFVVLSHQTIDQVPERMRGALQNVELELTFRTGREDAEYQARTIGTVDPKAIKHEVDDEAAAERGHPAFFSLGEQWELVTQQITGLKKRFAYVRHPSGSVTKVRSPHLPDPIVDPKRLAEIEAFYLRQCFVPPARAIAEPAVAVFGRELPFRPVERIA